MSQYLANIDLNQLTYHLPDEKIAKYPLLNRDDSKLLVWRPDGIHHAHFSELIPNLPEKSLLIFNDTKVIPARLIFHKATGARIELFLLEPVAQLAYEECMLAREQCSWKVMIGNARKWKNEPLTVKLADDLELIAEREGEDQVIFRWNSTSTFSEILTEVGQIPLPPYLGRDATTDDLPRYQTVYSKAEGAVAAPTAGLHFTTAILDQLQPNGIQQDQVTLHVSAGTFQPIKAQDVREHPMHREHILIQKSTIKNLLINASVVAVGTTSMRTLESLFWYGQLLETDPNALFHIQKLAPYRDEPPVSREKSLSNILDYMERKGLEKLSGQTEIFIVPGYTFQICQGLITNFHQPGSTLILLVAAFTGKDWKHIYEEALNADYRFLSYGDSSLLLPNS